MRCQKQNSETKSRFSRTKLRKLNLTQYIAGRKNKRRDKGTALHLDLGKPPCERRPTVESSETLAPAIKGCPWQNFSREKKVLLWQVFDALELEQGGQIGREKCHMGSFWPKAAIP